MLAKPAGAFQEARGAAPVMLGPLLPPKKKKPARTRSVWVDDLTWARLGELAADDGRTRNELIASVLERFVAEHGAPSSSAKPRKR